MKIEQAKKRTLANNESTVDLVLIKMEEAHYLLSVPLVKMQMCGWNTKSSGLSKASNRRQVVGKGQNLKGRDSESVRDVKIDWSSLVD